MTEQGPQDRSDLSQMADNPEAVKIAHYYDAWAEDYDHNLMDWNYEAPLVSAERFKLGVPLNAKVLDAGCGTGLSGSALKKAGFLHIAGMDISRKSLKFAAKTGAYEALSQVNMQRLPLPYQTNAFGGLQCVGVLTYVPDTEGILREFCRIVSAGGLVIFTQRDDLYKSRDCAAVMQDLVTEGLWEQVSISEPMSYLPGNPDYGDNIRVIYCTFRVSRLWSVF